MCMICRDTEKPTRFIPLYVIGSEGLDLCHDCEMILVQFVRKLMSENASKKLAVSIAKRTNQDKGSKKLNKNSLVMYRNRCQISSTPMRVTQVKIVDGQRLLKVNDRWYPEMSFMPYEEWKEMVDKNG